MKSKNLRFLDVMLISKSRFFPKSGGSLLESESVPPQGLKKPGGARSRFLKGSRVFLTKNEIYRSALNQENNT